MTTEWSVENRVEAAREGWDIFDSDGSENGPWQIQCFDDPGEGEAQLEADTDGWEIVWRKAEEGSALHIQALAFIQEHNPTEYKAIVLWMKEHS